MSKLKWEKVRAGLYFTKYDNHILAVIKIEATDVTITGWWIIEIYDIKGEFIVQLDAYITLRKAKLAAVRDYKDWNK